MQEKFYQIKKDVVQAITLGQTIDEIKARMTRTNPDLGLDVIDGAVEKICKNYPDYNLIQKVMRSSLVMDKDDEESKIMILDTANRDVDTISPTRLKGMLNPKINLKDRLYTCSFEYRPFDKKMLVSDNNGAWAYNTYVPPFWFEDAFYSEGKIDLEPLEHIPPIYSNFLLHLVDSNKESYDYILDWLANAMQNRNYCILTTIGRQGIGKGILGEIMRHLFGDRNFAGPLRDEVFRRQFNSQLINKRLVYLDEVKIDNPRMEDKVKAVINDFIEVEQKGRDAKEIRNYASFYLSSNRLDSLKLEGDDRRFSIVDLTSEKLIEKFNTTELTDMLFSPSSIELFARYLMTRPVDHKKMMKVFISDRTMQVRDSSLKDWEEWVLEDLAFEKSGKNLPIKEVSYAIFEEFGIKPGRKKLQDLQSRFPEKLHVTNSKENGDSKRMWRVRFLEEKND